MILFRMINHPCSLHQCCASSMLCFRSKLSYEQFAQFLHNIKELNAGRQNRDETLRRVRDIFGYQHQDLFGKQPHVVQHPPRGGSILCRHLGSAHSLIASRGQTHVYPWSFYLSQVSLSSCSTRPLAPSGHELRLLLSESKQDCSLSCWYSLSAYNG